ncbi:MAG: hypothetical protein AB8B60_00205 [Sulfitobacter sp.]
MSRPSNTEDHIMYRKFIAVVAATSIALTAIGASAAHAGDHRKNNAQANTIAALLGLAVVGALIQENRKDKKKEAQVHHRSVPAYKHPKHHTPKYTRPAYTPPRYQQPEPRPLPRRVNRKLLPKECLRSFNSRNGKVRMFPQRCLNSNYQFAHRLPQQCNYVFNTPRGDRRGYEARCLRDRGYRLARG